MKIISSINREVLDRTIQRAKERNIILPTFAQQRDPKLIPAKIVEKLKKIDLQAVAPLNLFRITWKNDPKTGGFGDGNWLEFPKAITGVDTRIVCLLGRYFPTGSHKVGAAYGCLVPRLVSGNFDPTAQKAVWPSTGNYCRGGAFDCALLACPAIAIMPEGMSQERFEWLRSINTDEIIATPGTESNVKEIYDMCWKLRRERGDKIVIFNQFEELGNSIWHYNMTGTVIEEIYQKYFKTDDTKLAAYISATGSAGTIAAGDYLRTQHPAIRVVASEALQCPTLYQFGFGAHRIEGIGDKHIPFVHNVKNTDMVCAIDDNNSQNLLRLFNSEIGHDYLVKETGVSKDLLEELSLLGISGIANVLGLIKMARYYEMTDKDVLVTVATDSAEMYQSRITELDECEVYTPELAARDYWHHLKAIKTDNMMELNYWERKRVHNLKYYTWVEQQGRTLEELNAQWYDDKYWDNIHAQVDEIDRLTEEFNKMSGELESLKTTVQ